MGRSLRRVFVSFIAGSMFLGGAAFAADPLVIADQIVAALTDDNRAATYESATEADGIVTITGFDVADEPNGLFATVAEIVVVDPVERETGFVAETIRLFDGEITVGANVVRWDLVELADVIVPPLADLGADAGPEIPLTAVEIERVSIVSPQTSEVTIDRVAVQLGEAVEGVPYSVMVMIDGIEVPTDAADNSDPFAILRDMGFPGLTMDISVVGTFDSENDTLVAESIGIDIRDFGNFQIAGVFSGLPLSLLQEPGGFDLLLASAMVDVATVRFENNGAMEAFMRVQAEMMGIPPEDAAPALAVAFQILLGAFDNPELAQQVGVAVGVFLRDPQTITIVAEPDEQVPLLAIIPLIVGNPNGLPTLLDVVLTAND